MTIAVRKSRERPARKRAGPMRVAKAARLGPFAGEGLERLRAACRAYPVHKAQGTDAARGRSKQALPERTRVETVADFQPLTAAADLTRGDRLAFDEQLVQASRPGKTRGERCLEHAGGRAQPPLGVFLGEELQEPLRRYPGPAPEQAPEEGFRK